MSQVIIRLDDPNLLSKKYRLRKTGAYGGSTEVTMPQEVVDREARRLGLSRDEALDVLRAVWKYGNFRGIYLVFEEIEKSGEEDGI